MQLFFLGIALTAMGSLYCPPRVNPHVVISTENFKKCGEHEKVICETQPLRTREQQVIEIPVRAVYCQRYDGSPVPLGRRVHETLSECCRSQECLQKTLGCGFLCCFSGIWLLSFLIP